jgi:hypothetical protein
MCSVEKNIEDLRTLMLEILKQLAGLSKHTEQVHHFKFCDVLENYL